MANAQKYTRAACGHLAAHYERRKDEKGEYVKFGNQDIDPQKTHLNYNLAPRRGVEQIDFIRQRTTEARTLKRDDVNVMCSWVVTLPEYRHHNQNLHVSPDKEQYDPSERITGNNFDIGAYEQLGTAEKNEMFLEMGQAIREHGFTNYMDFYEFVVDTYEDMNYIEVMRCYSGHFERMTRGNYQRWEQGQRGLRPSQAKLHENSTNTTPDCCPACGSVDIVKSGKTLANTQRWACKDCGKRFV